MATEHKQKENFRKILKEVHIQDINNEFLIQWLVFWIMWWDDKVIGESKKHPA